MRIRQGWSGQVSANPDRWAKVDVELEEEDLRRLLHGLYAGPADLDQFLKACPTGLVFALLEAEAEILVMIKLMARHGYPADEGRAKLTALRTAKAGILAKIKEIAA